MSTTVINNHQVLQESEIADVYTAQRFFTELGIDTLPIPYGKKAPPLISGWPTVSSTEAWTSVSNATNIAIRCGEKKALRLLIATKPKLLISFTRHFSVLALLLLLFQ